MNGDICLLPFLSGAFIFSQKIKKLFVYPLKSQLYAFYPKQANWMMTWPSGLMVVSLFLCWLVQSPIPGCGAFVARGLLSAISSKKEPKKEQIELCVSEDKEAKYL